MNRLQSRHWIGNIGMDATKYRTHLVVVPGFSTSSAHIQGYSHRQGLIGKFALALQVLAHAAGNHRQRHIVQLDIGGSSDRLEIIEIKLGGVKYPVPTHRCVKTGFGGLYIGLGNFIS